MLELDEVVHCKKCGIEIFDEMYADEDYEIEPASPLCSDCEAAKHECDCGEPAVMEAFGHYVCEECMPRMRD